MKVAKFIFSGVLNTVLTYIFYVLLIKLGFEYFIALLFEYILGILTGYIINRYWTFATQKRFEKYSFVKYLSTYIALFGLNFILLSIFVENLIFEPIFGQFIALGVITTLSYSIQKKWIFKVKSLS